MLVSEKKNQADVQGAYLLSMIRSVVLTSNPSVLWPAASPLLAEFGKSPSASLR